MTTNDENDMVSVKAFLIFAVIFCLPLVVFLYFLYHHAGGSAWCQDSAFLTNTSLFGFWALALYPTCAIFIYSSPMQYVSDEIFSDIGASYLIHGFVALVCGVIISFIYYGYSHIKPESWMSFSYMGILTCVLSCLLSWWIYLILIPALSEQHKLPIGIFTHLLSFIIHIGAALLSLVIWTYVHM